MRPSPDCPIIIGGCHRSGTTLVRRILDNHSRIHCGPEVKFFGDFYGAYVDRWRALRFFETAQTLVSQDEMLEVLGRSFIELHERAARSRGKARWADKVPENTIYLRQWQRLLNDNWLFVHVVRNPLDTTASLVEAGFYDLPSTVPGLIDHYRGLFNGGLRFASEHPARYHRVVYEQLVTQPGETLDELMAFLGESTESDQLLIEGDDRGIGTIPVTTEVHASSMHRWPAVLSEADAQLVWDRAFDLWGLVDPDDKWVRQP